MTISIKDANFKIETWPREYGGKDFYVVYARVVGQYWGYHWEEIGRCDSRFEAHELIRAYKLRDHNKVEYVR